MSSQPHLKETDEPDDRQTSRAQRWVFNKFMCELPPEVIDRYNFLSSTECKERGKRGEINKIVNMYVPRSD